MSSSKLYELTRVVGEATRAIVDSERLPVRLLSVRANKLAEAYPTDQTVVGMRNFLARRVETLPRHGKELMTKGELKEVYNSFYISNNKFAEAFSDELGVSKLDTPVMKRDPQEGSPLADDAYNRFANPILANELTSVFDDTVPYKSYSEFTAKDAQKTCAYELNCLGMFPKRIDVVAGEPNVIVCRASYETPRGEGHVLVPVEIENGKALLPTMFLNKDGFVNLNEQLIKEHLDNTAGKPFVTNVQKLLEAVSAVKNGVPQQLSDVDRVMMKASLEKETPSSYDVHGIIGHVVDEEVKPIEDVQYKLPGEMQDLSDRLSSGVGAAKFMFGKDAVEQGRAIVLGVVNDAGFGGAQVSVSDVDNDGVLYSVSVDGKCGFKIPIKMGKAGPVSPKVIVASGNLFEFSVDGINKLVTSGASDQLALAQTSQVHGMRASDVVDYIRKAMSNKHYERAEDALNVLRHSDDDHAYKTAYAVYINGLSGGSIEKTASSSGVTGCSAPVKVSNSKYMACSHTGLPVHKVYQDEGGNCLPLYRKRMEDTQEGSGCSFLHSKVFVD
jgi:hypothetical protein